jgi:hypothetical protein
MGFAREAGKLADLFVVRKPRLMRTRDLAYETSCTTRVYGRSTRPHTTIAGEPSERFPCLVEFNEIKAMDQVWANRIRYSNSIGATAKPSKQRYSTRTVDIGPVIHLQPVSHHISGNPHPSAHETSGRLNPAPRSCHGQHPFPSPRQLPGPNLPELAERW